MEISSDLIPLLFSLLFSPITWICIGWIIFCLVVSIRTGVEAGFRLFLLGLRVLLTLVTIGAILLYLPDWASIGILSVWVISAWVPLLRYFLATRFAGKLLMTLPSNNETWTMTIWRGIFSILVGLQSFTLHNNDFLSPAKLNALGICLISFGVFKVLVRLGETQIRELGILSVKGGLYTWDNIEQYRWKFGEDKLSLQLKKAWFRRDVNLKILSQFRREVVAHLSQHVSMDGSSIEAYAPVQKPG
jgi:hypothetical protein